MVMFVRLSSAASRALKYFIRQWSLAMEYNETFKQTRSICIVYVQGPIEPHYIIMTKYFNLLRCCRTRHASCAWLNNRQMGPASRSQKSHIEIIENSEGNVNSYMICIYITFTYVVITPVLISQVIIMPLYPDAKWQWDLLHGLNMPWLM